MLEGSANNKLAHTWQGL